jgi:hypothetical protein
MNLGVIIRDLEIVLMNLGVIRDLEIVNLKVLVLYGLLVASLGTSIVGATPRRNIFFMNIFLSR